MSKWKPKLTEVTPCLEGVGHGWQGGPVSGQGLGEGGRGEGVARGRGVQQVAGL